MLDFLRELSDLAGLESSVLTILLKVLGIGLISQLAQLLCADSGNGAMGKALQILAGAVTLWLALPLFRVPVGTGPGRFIRRVILLTVFLLFLGHSRPGRHHGPDSTGTAAGIIFQKPRIPSERGCGRC